MSSFSSTGPGDFPQPRHASTGGASGGATGDFGGRVYTEEQRRVVERLQKLAYLLDARFRVPGTEFRVGLDGLLGLVPGIGDTAAFALSAYIILEAQKLDVPAHVTARMLANVFADLLVGAIPVLGDFFDFAFKANLRNLRLIGIEPRWA